MSGRSTAWRKRLLGAITGSFIVLAGAGSLPAIAAGDVPAAVAAKIADGCDLWSRLSADPTLRLRVIVQFAQPAMAAAASFATEEDRDAALKRAIHAAQDDILADLSPTNGLSAALTEEKNVKRMDFTPVFGIVVNAEELATLAANPNVVSIVEDVPLVPALTQTLPLIGIPQMYAAGFDGDGYSVAVLDGGARTTHKFLSSQIVSEACYNTAAGAPYNSTSRCPGGASSATGPGAAEDCVTFASTEGCGHGTLVSGIAAGFNTNPLAGEPTSGVARGARIISINIQSLFDTSSGECSPGYSSCLRAFNSDVIRGLERVYALRNMYNIAAVNLSHSAGVSSTACNSSPMRSTIDLLRSERIATIISVGNDSNDAAVGDPSCISAAIAVAASTKSDDRAASSNWGPLVDLVAPGESVISSYVNGGSDTTFAISGGTSLAAAHVAGAFAVLREVRPDATITEIENALKNTGVSITSAGVTKPRIHVDDARAALQSGTDLDPAAPANNDFAEATVVAAAGTLSGSNIGADAQPGEPLHAGTTSARKTVWWSYTPNQSGTVTITTQGSAFDTVMGVYTGSAVNSLALVGSNDDNPSSGLWSRVSFSATIDTTYHIAVAGYSSSAGSIILNVTGGYLTPPVNDDFADRTVIAAEGAVTGTNVAAGSELGEPLHASITGADDSVWWSYIATDSGTVTVDTEGSAIDTVLAVYTGSAVNSVTEVASNDDNGTAGVWAQVSFEVEPGTEYKIAVAGKAGAEGAITLNVDEAPPLSPANDDFADRAVIAAAGTVTGTNVDAWEETGEPLHAGVAGARESVWWSYTAIYSGTVTVDTNGSAIDTAVGIYTGSAVNALTEVASNDDNGTGGTWSRASFPAVAGTEYKIAVAGKAGAEGAISLTVNEAPPFPANDNFANRIAIASPGTVSGTSLWATAESGEPIHAGRSNARKSVWWGYTPSQSGTITIHTNGSAFDTVLAVYSGTAVNALTPVASNDDNGSGGTWSSVSFNAIAGTQYSIAVAGYNSASGTISLSVQNGGGSSGNSIIVAATAPAARTTAVGSEVTAFATILNGGSVTATACAVAKPAGSYPFDFSYRLRDYRTGALGKDNTPVNIPPGGRQDFLMVFTPTAPISDVLPMVFDCSNTPPAGSLPGVNTFMLTARTPAPADIVSNAVTSSSDGLLRVPAEGYGVAALAALNMGPSTSLHAELSATPIGGTAAPLPLGLTICRTDPTTGQCITAASDSVSFSIGSGQIVTFTAFAQRQEAAIGFQPAERRLHVHFYEGSTPVSSSSVAVCTIGAAGCPATGAASRTAELGGGLGG